MKQKFRLIGDGVFIRVFDLFGFTRTNNFFWIVVCITISLIIFEWKYNVDLLTALSDPGLENSSANELSQRGKFLAAFGISWAIGKGLLSKIKPAGIGLVIFSSLVLLMHQGLDYTYTTVISNLAPEVKVNGFNIFSYRKDILLGTLEDPDIPLPSVDPILGKIFMGAFPIVLLDERFMLPAQDIIQRKANDKSNAVLRMAEKSWKEYDLSMKNLSDSHGKYISASKKSLKQIPRDDIDWIKYNEGMQDILQSYSKYIEASKKATDDASEWYKYSSNMDGLVNSYNKYIDGSRKASNYGNRGRQKFLEQSGGLEPNAGLSRNGFIEMLRTSPHPEGEKLRHSEAKVIASRSNGQNIYGKDVPYFMSRYEFSNWYSNQAKADFNAIGMQPNQHLSKLDFVKMLRSSKHPKSEQLRLAESRIVGKKINGENIYGRDMPYFMPFEDFSSWVSNVAKENLRASGFEANSKLSINEFVAMLRNSNTKDGENLIKSENKEIGKRPDGTVVYAKEIPYFLSHIDYMNWFTRQADEAKSALIPTVANVDEFIGINDVNSAVFLPPMAIISSLTSALTNSISLIIMLMSCFFMKVDSLRFSGRVMQKLALPLMIFIFSLLLISMPSHVFKENTQIYELETTFHENVGIAARIWSKLSNFEKFIL